MWGDKHFQRNEWSSEKLLHLFNSQGGPKPRGKARGYSDLLKNLMTGSIEGRELKLLPTKRPTAPTKGGRQSADFALFKACKRGGGDLHGWLKWWAYKWLETQATAPPELEYALPGYGRADLFSPHLNTVVECGNTSAMHVINFLKMAPSNRFVLVPFQRAAIANIGELCISALTAYEFSNQAMASDARGEAAINGARDGV